MYQKLGDDMALYAPFDTISRNGFWPSKGVILASKRDSLDAIIIHRLLIHIVEIYSWYRSDRLSKRLLLL